FRSIFFSRSSYTSVTNLGEHFTLLYGFSTSGHSAYNSFKCSVIQRSHRRNQTFNLVLSYNGSQLVFTSLQFLLYFLFFQFCNQSLSISQSGFFFIESSFKSSLQSTHLFKGSLQSGELGLILRELGLQLFELCHINRHIRSYLVFSLLENIANRHVAS